MDNSYCNAMLSNAVISFYSLFLFLVFYHFGEYKVNNA